ncbi:MAG: hypothetical protein K2J83_01005, partial [Clostridia bacterium]|nr:hypothetical protein [Clostridia bacterium]
GGNAIPAEVVVALLQAVNNGGNAVPVNTNAIPAPAPAALPQSVEESTQSTHAQYPSDAVITTTTTVDTTQKSATQVGREISRTERSAKSDFIDVDGFYDEI